MIHAFVLFAALQLSGAASDVARDSLFIVSPERCGLHDSAALRHCRKALETEGENFAVRWRAAYFAASLANREKKDASRNALLQEARANADWAVARHPDKADGWFVLALCEGIEASHCGARHRVELSRRIRVHLDHGLAVDSSHPGLRYLSGRWNYSLANLSAMERSFVNLLLGGVPKGASNEAALSDLVSAVHHRPEEILFRLDLVRTLHAMKRDREAREECAHALLLKPRTDDDPENLAKLRRLQKDL
jgi:hypothetical protein